ncbi:hypothetical protein K9M53_01520 [Ferruginibacter albus]|nr:hypothetical protein K9M53_01520 [Ferruginibacter albus]
MFCLLPFSFFILSSCSKDSFITSPNASLTTSDTIIKFDTVFTSVGSVTQTFRIANNNDQKILLSQVKLMGGNTSPFTININGIPANEANNIEIAANDSIYVFVTVNINPAATNLPFIVNDSILINYNGVTKFVQLQAYGQNAHFINSLLIDKDTTWTNDLPYVIQGLILVDKNVTLTLDKGVRIYSHADAPFIVDGTLIANGTEDSNVVFTGDRLDEVYKDLPASWPGVYFRSTGVNSALTHTVIKNAYQALVIDSASNNSNPKLTLHQCIIDNAYDVGLYGYNSFINADNCLISNCGSNVSLNNGGNYTFTNCTIATFGNSYITHKNPVLQASDNDETASTINTLTASFTNCIIWGDYGSVDDEVVVNKQSGSSIVTLNHSLYKAKSNLTNINFDTSIPNADPKFDSINVNRRIFDFHITKRQSPAVDAGTPTSFTLDLDDKSRVVNNLTDIGCYEKQ